ncbi:sugar transferase [Bacillus sp. ISL-39]|uniref:sugar transferase n=1 Tax=Bacillus sp. ISL-39 TaxID=2819124 RepID=UPI00203547CD|nr:sugar transferase [Bacillus sp. ISL-39]
MNDFKETKEGHLVHLEIRTKYLLFKRAMDLTIGICSLILLLPVMIIVSILIYLLDGKPILFKQARTGLREQTFTIYKFRTMKPQNNQSIHKYRWDGGVPDDFVFKTTVNPNVTKLGATLRKLSLDELPQLFNVIKGDMSIVGPRPEIPEITRLYSSHQKMRLLVKPGITGYAQVNGRANSTHGEKIWHDLYYLGNCSCMLDLKIILKTIYQVIVCKGSY